jgi:hypothetical protein
MVVVVLGSLSFWVSPAGAAATKAGEPTLPLTAPVQGALNSVNCSSSTACVAVGSYSPSGSQLPLAEAWNGSAWAVQQAPTPAGGSDSALFGVSCASSVACLAVGDYYNGHANTALAESWDGADWTIQTVPLPTGALAAVLLGVSCSSAGECMAVGYYANSSNTNVALAESWNGSSFTAETVPTPVGATTSVLEAVGCSPSPSLDCEAVGWSFLGGAEVAMTLPEGWNGTEWSVQSAPPPPDASGGSYPSGMSCNAPHSCISVGSEYDGSGDLADGWAQRWNGTAWTNQVLTSPTGAIDSAPTAVSCSPAPSKACTVVGYYSNGSAFVSLAEAWKGSKWSVQKTPQPKGATTVSLGGVSCSSPTGCTGVGDDIGSSGVSVTLADSSSGTKWKVQKTPKL